MNERRPGTARPWRQLQLALAAMLALLAFGTIGFRISTGAGYLDALFMTVITVSTVGYDTHIPIDSAADRLFTILLILAALVVIAWAVRGLAEVVFADVVMNSIGRRRMQSRIDHLRHHVIVCGYGRMGRGVLLELEAEGQTPVVVTLQDSDEVELRETGRLAVVGDATRDETLLLAGVASARALIAVTDSDAINVMVALSARAMNPGLRIAARADHPETEGKLRRAGADYVLHQHGTGAMHLALAVTHPVVEEVLNRLIPRQGGLDMGQLEVADDSTLVGVTLADLRGRVRTALVLAVCRGDDVFLPPDPLSPLRAHDVLVVVGPAGALKEMRDLAGE